MNMEHLKDLYRKYLEGETTRFEEEHLKTHADGMKEGDKQWLNYLNRTSQPSPEDIEESASKYIDYKQYRRISLTKLIAVAASVLIIVSIGLILYPRQKEMSYIDKLVALTEARMLSSESTQDSQEEIIYEDESIIIYFK